MKTVNHKNLLGASMAVAMALAAWLPTATSAADETRPMKPMKGGEHLIMLHNNIKTKQDLAALKTDDCIAMVCAKCKTVWFSSVKQGAKGAELLMGGGRELIGTHECAGCKSTMTVSGHANGDNTDLKYSCKACGDDSAFCCATKPGSGATKGK